MMGPMGCFETSVKNYQSTQRNIQEVPVYTAGEPEMTEYIEKENARCNP